MYIDGWTKDKAAIKYSIHSQIPMPTVGKKVNLLVVYVEDVEKFYAQIIHKNCKNVADLPAARILEDMNNPTMVAKYKMFSKPPGNLLISIPKTQF